MFMLKCCSLMVLLPVSIFLTLSFFVLLVLRKVEEKWLKAFGYFIVSFLILSTLIVFSGVAYSMIKGARGGCMLRQKMKMGAMSGMMQQNSMPCMEMKEQRIFSGK